MPDLFELAAVSRALAVDVEALNRTNTELAATVAENTATQERQARRIDRAEGLITRTWVLLAAAVVLAGLFGMLAFRQVVTEDRLNQVISAQQEARQKGQCPLLALFIGSYNPNSRAAGEDRQRYEDAFRVIRQSYADLDCEAEQPVVPGSTSTPTPPR